ncbi:MAG TPA: malate dehydrogenase [Chloroflexota bacterium]|nr:malate dehydrogenase [Chloroflexota bacterium]
MRKKVSIIGAGQTGASTAQRIAQTGYADVILTDVVEGLAEGKALDLQESAPVVGFDAQVTGATTSPDGNGYEPTANSDLVIITSGIARKPGMSRDDLLAVNQKVITTVVQAVVRQSPECVIVMLTNPVDAMTQLAYKVSGFPANRVIGQAGILDTARYKTFIALELGVSFQDVDAYVLGGHGDTMVPLPRYTIVGGRPLTSLLAADKIEAIIERTRRGGEEIVKYLKTGSAYYAPSAALAEMANAILLDQQRILPCCAYLTGQYGMNGLYVGVPVKLGQNGVEEIIEFDLNAEESKALQQSGDAVRGLIQAMKI